MQRRSFLQLLGLGAVAIATPEPVRTYFVGGWPTSPQPMFSKGGIALVTDQTITVSTHEYRAWVVDQVEHRTLPRALAARTVDLSDAAEFLPSIWHEGLLEAVDFHLTLDPLIDRSTGRTIDVPRIRNLAVRA